MFELLACVMSSIFFFKQKTAYEMRISDWSADVCSSDLSRGDVSELNMSASRLSSREKRTCARSPGGRLASSITSPVCVSRIATAGHSSAFGPPTRERPESAYVPKFTFHPPHHRDSEERKSVTEGQRA